MKNKKIVWVITNQNAKGEIKTGDYCTTNIAPKIMASYQETWIVDIHDPQNQMILESNDKCIKGYKIDDNYMPEKHYEYIYFNRM